MENEDRRKFAPQCDLCGEPASMVQGGEYQGVFKLWLTCKECHVKIKDWRKNHQNK